MKYSCSVQILVVYITETPQTYAIPSRDMENFKKYIDDFLVYAKQHPEYTFLVTEIGCGISGHSPSEIAPLFKEALKMDNIHLPLVFWDILNGGIKGRIRQIAEVEALSVPEFCVRIGIPVTELMNLLFGNADPTIWTIRKILIAFPYINARWLLLGEGDMKPQKRNNFITKISCFL